MVQFILKHPIAALFLVIGSLINVGSRVNDAYTLWNSGLPNQVWEAIGATVFFAAVIVLLYRWNAQRDAVASNAEDAVPVLVSGGPNFSPLADVTMTVPQARLRLLMRPQQDPEELTNENVYRWFTFQSLAKKPETGEIEHIGTYIFLVFRHPVMPNYKRVFSSTHPELRLEAIDITSRSMVVIINSDPKGAILEMHLSEKPI